MIGRVHGGAVAMRTVAFPTTVEWRFPNRDRLNADRNVQLNFSRPNPAAKRHPVSRTGKSANPKFGGGESPKKTSIPGNKKAKPTKTH